VNIFVEFLEGCYHLGLQDLWFEIADGKRGLFGSQEIRT